MAKQESGSHKNKKFIPFTKKELETVTLQQLIDRGYDPDSNEIKRAYAKEFGSADEESEETSEAVDGDSKEKNTSMLEAVEKIHQKMLRMEEEYQTQRKELVALLEKTLEEEKDAKLKPKAEKKETKIKKVVSQKIAKNETPKKDPEVNPANKKALELNQINVEFLKNHCENVKNLFDVCDGALEKIQKNVAELKNLYPKKASIVEQLLEKFNAKIKEIDVAHWKKVVEEINTTGKTSNNEIQRSLKQLQAESEKQREFSRFLFSRLSHSYSSQEKEYVENGEKKKTNKYFCVDTYPGSILVLEEELRNIHRFINEDKKAVEDIEQTSAESIQAILSASEKMGIKFRYVPLFENFKDHLGNMSAVDGDTASTHENVTGLHKEDISEIFSYGFKSEFDEKQTLISIGYPTKSSEEAPVETKESDKAKSEIAKESNILFMIDRLRDMVASKIYPLSGSTTALMLNDEGKVIDEGIRNRDTGVWKSFGAPDPNEAKQVEQMYKADKETLEILESPLVDKILTLVQQLKGETPRDKVNKLEALFSERGYTPEQVGKIGGLYVGNLAKWLSDSREHKESIEKIIDDELANLENPKQKEKTENTFLSKEIERLENKLAKLEYSIPNTSGKIRLNPDGSMKDAGDYYDDKWDSNFVKYGEEVMRRNLENDYQKVKKLYDDDMAQLKIMQSPIAQKTIKLANSLGGLEQLKNALNEYPYEEIGNTASLNYAPELWLKSLLRDPEKIASREKIIDAELAKLTEGNDIVIESPEPTYEKKLFLKAPGPEGFSSINARNKSNGEEIFELLVQPGGTKAFLGISKDLNNQKYVITGDIEYYFKNNTVKGFEALQRNDGIKEDIKEGKKRMIVSSYGEAELVGGLWKITRPVEISVVENLQK